MLDRIPAAARPRLRMAAMAGAFLASLSGAYAQGVDCSRLQAQIASMGPGDQTQAARYADAARKQQYELERTQGYAQSIGCNNRQFLFFGSAPPPQCNGLEAQIQRMKGNLAGLQAQARNAADGGRGELIARYNAACRADTRPRGGGSFLDTLFGGGGGVERPQNLGDDPNFPAAPVDDTPRGGSKAVCVRTCDGGFFPLNVSSRRGDLDEMCHALCPGAEARAYTYSPSGDIDQAVGTDGTPYRSLPNAFKFRTKYDSTCTCKPANKSWVQALADAEALLGRSKNDIMVTQEKSDELSRIAGPGVKPVKPPAKPTAKPAVSQPDNDPTLAQEAAANAQSPTAGNESAGIAAGTGGTAKTYGLKDGQMKDEPTPDGKRKVRVVGPTL